MKHDDLFVLFVSVYGRIQEEMVAIGLADNETGKVIKPKKPTINETDGIYVYNYLFDKLKHLRAEQMGKYAEQSNEVLHKLLNDKEKPINSYLMAMLLFRSYLQDIATRPERDMLLPKINRSVELFEEFKEQEYKDIKKNSARASDNIYRLLIGRPQLSDEVRDARFKRIVK